MEGPLIWVITNISTDFDEKFRRTFAEKNKGFRKGDLRKAVIEAVEQWMEKQELSHMIKKEVN